VTDVVSKVIDVALVRRRVGAFEGIEEAPITVLVNDKQSPVDVLVVDCDSDIFG
jgi:hypothetical protein